MNINMTHLTMQNYIAGSSFQQTIRSSINYSPQTLIQATLWIILLQYSPINYVIITSACTFSPSLQNMIDTYTTNNTQTL